MTRKKGSKFVAIAGAILVVGLLFSACGKPVVSSSGNPEVSSGSKPGQESPKDYVIPELPLADNELPRVAQTLYEMEIMYSDQSNTIRPLLALGDGRKVLLAYSSHWDEKGYHQFYDNAELLLVDGGYQVLQTKALEGGLSCSEGTSFFEGKGCFTLGGALFVVDENLETESYPLPGIAEPFQPHMTVDGTFFVQDRFVLEGGEPIGRPKRLYEVSGEADAALVFETPTNDPFWRISFDSSDTPQQFRVYTNKQIWRMDTAGTKQVLFDDFEELKGVDYSWSILSMLNRIQYSADRKFIYIVFEDAGNEEFSLPKIEHPHHVPKDVNAWTAVRGCPFALRYAVQEDGSFVFDTELYAHYAASDTEPPPFTAAFVDDINGNGYILQNAKEGDEQFSYYEARRIEGDLLRGEVAFQYAFPRGDLLDFLNNSSFPRISEYLNRKAMEEIRNQAVLGFLTLGQDDKVTSLFLNPTRHETETGFQAINRDAIVQFDFSHKEPEDIAAKNRSRPT